MKKLTSKTICLLLAFVLALSPVTGSAVTVFAGDEETAAEADSRITYTGEKVGFFKEDGVSEFGMLSLQEGSKVVVDGDQVKIYDVPSNKMIYDGLHWGFITDEELTKDVLALEDGCWSISVGTDNCGYGIPVAPVKTEARGGGTTASQYYLCIPTQEKLKTIADYSGVDAALASVPEDLSVYTEESAKAVTDAVEETKAADFRFYSTEEQAAVDAAAEAINSAVARLEEAASSGIEDGTYLLPELKAGPSAMFNHFVEGSKYLTVNGDQAVIRFITDGSTASIQKYSKIALGRSSELVQTAYQAELPEGTTIIEGKLQPAFAGTGKDQYLFKYR